MIVPRIILEILSGIIFPKKSKAIFSSLFWILKNKKSIMKNHKKTQKIRVIQDKEIQGILKKSIAFLYFIKRKKQFNEIEKYF